MKPLLLAVLALAGTVSAYPRFTEYEECVTFCDNDPTCQSAFFDTISGDCQYHACLDGRTPPDRFRKYVKAGAAGYCSGTSPTATSAGPTATSTEVPTSVSQAGSASTESSGASVGWAVSRGDVVPAVAVAWMVVGILR
ncbi:uncharacterized protein B0H64DRAFT_121518 [Chaetomium fimeti]|uniref:Extracellular membrane protein CFEM domain-containing protein n=1 Tax=Chaetomium fimeti TaxID=1854472 RepID=A0AAE0HIQ2_9PEZI|nr:hypothetical protein B0H64DRAFT_121518 [Chaetomium fimeti]